MNIDGVSPQFLSQLFEDNNIKMNQSYDEIQKLGIEGLVQILNTNIKDGLNTNNLLDLNLRKQKYGINTPPIPKAKTFWHCVYVSTHDFCIRILILAAILMVICGFFAENTTEVFAQAFSIFLAVLAVIFIAGTTDWQKDQQYRDLIKAANSSSSVQGIRDGQQKEIVVDDILVGDILILGSGSYLSVDGIYLQKPNSSQLLEVDESSLTGVSEIIIKRPYKEGQYDVKENFFLRSGSNIYQGDGLMLVCCVGEHTMLGKIKSNIHEVNEFSYLGDTTAQLAKLMVYIGGFFSVLMLFILLYWDENELEEEEDITMLSERGLQKFLADFLAAFMILVFSVPEGLPLVITLSLANSVMELKKNGVQVRNLNSCTYLSGLDMICFDKTGTLTKNMIQVSNFYSEHILCETPECKHSLSLQTRDKLKDAIFSTNSAMVEIIDTSDKQQDEEAFLDQKKEINLKLDGNKIDQSLIIFLKNNFSEINIKQEYDYWSSSEHRLKQQKLPGTTPSIIMTVTALNEANKYRIYFKGVKENMLDRCKFFLEKPNENEELAQISELNEDILNKIRVKVLEKKENSKLLILAYQDFEIANLSEEDWNDGKYQKDFILIGLLNIQDEIRSSAKNAIKLLKDYHIESRMTTGDVKEPSFHVATSTLILDPTLDFTDPITKDLILEAQELNDRVGIIGESKGELSLIKEEYLPAFKQILQKFKVICNASAQDKQLVVKGLQEHMNHIVAYIGDGNNDVKALNCSDIGFVMGIGTPIAKESCNLILKSNDIEGIVHAVEWGRNVYLNLQRFIFLQLSFFIVSTILMVTSSITIEDSPYSVLQIIWLSLIHDVFSSIALSFDKPVKDIGRNIKPIKRGQSLIDTYILLMIISQVTFQLLASFFVLYYTPEIFGILPSEDYDINDLDTKFVPRQAIHYTIVFHTTTLLQIFNMPNARNIGHKEIIFITDLFNNYIFWGITILCYVIQMSIVEYGGEYFKCAQLNFVQNFFCHFVAGGTFVVYIVMKKILEFMKI